jgi:hypothetical protein
MAVLIRYECGFLWDRMGAIIIKKLAKFIVNISFTSKSSSASKLL